MKGEEKDLCFHKMKDYVTHVTNLRMKFIFLKNVINKYLRVEKFRSIAEEVPNFELMLDSKPEFIFFMKQENEKILNLIASCTQDWFKIRNKPIVGT